MYLLYADDAGNTGIDYDNPQQPIFNLAGVIVPAEQWHDLNQRIDNLKRACFPDHPKAEFHATYIFNGSNDKKAGISFHNMSLYQRFEILSKVVDLIVSMSLSITKFSVNKQNLKTYCRKVFNNAVKIDPYYIAMPYVLSYFDAFLKARGSNGIVFFDEQSELLSSFDNVQERIRIFSENSNSLRVDHIIEQAMFLSSCKSNFVQMADVVNYFITRKMLLDHRGSNYSREQDQFVLAMVNKLSPLILKPPYDPTGKDPLRFFRDNGTALR